MRLLVIFTLSAFHTVAFAQNTPLAHELQSIGESNQQLKQSIQQAIQEGRTSEDECRAMATRLAEVLGPMLWPRELSGADVAARASVEGLMQAANAARAMSEGSPKPDELIAIHDQVQALIFQARFAIRRAEGNARMAQRLQQRDQVAAQAAQDRNRQNAARAATQQQRVAAAAAHQQQIRQSQATHRQALARQNRQAAQANARATRRARRSGFLRAAASIASAAPRARPAPRRSRTVTHHQTTTVSRTRRGGVRTTTRYRTTAR